MVGGGSLKHGEEEEKIYENIAKLHLNFRRANPCSPNDVSDSPRGLPIADLSNLSENFEPILSTWLDKRLQVETCHPERRLRELNSMRMQLHPGAKLPNFLQLVGKARVKAKYLRHRRPALTMTASTPLSSPLLRAMVSTRSTRL
uniref:Uncharacterized protein n=1 Tax=Solanum tuberosum TaxID=4113 RepID=M1DYL3_SOLTU